MMSERSTVIVVGYRSYVGHAVANFLESQGHEVVSATSSNCNLLDRQSIRLFADSLNQDKYDIVFAAALIKPLGNTFDGFMKNVLMVHNWLEVFDCERVRSLIFLSSVDVYGSSPKLPITEESPLVPDNWYGVSKIDCEWILQMHRSKFPITTLRIAGVYGPSLGDRSIVQNFVQQASRGCVVLRDGGKSKRDYVHVTDLARVIDECISSPFDTLVNVCSGETLRIIEIVDYIRRVFDLTFTIAHLPADGRSFDLIFSNEKLNSFLPQFKFLPFRHGLLSYG